MHHKVTSHPVCKCDISVSTLTRRDRDLRDHLYYEERNKDISLKKPTQDQGIGDAVRRSTKAARHLFQVILLCLAHSIKRVKII